MTSLCCWCMRVHCYSLQTRQRWCWAQSVSGRLWYWEQWRPTDVCCDDRRTRRSESERKIGAARTSVSVWRTAVCIVMTGGRKGARERLAPRGRAWACEGLLCVLWWQEDEKEREREKDRRRVDERERVKDCCVCCDDRRMRRSESERKNGAARRSASVWRSGNERAIETETAVVQCRRAVKTLTYLTHGGQMHERWTTEPVLSRTDCEAQILNEAATLTGEHAATEMNLAATGRGKMMTEWGIMSTTTERGTTATKSGVDAVLESLMSAEMTYRQQHTETTHQHLMTAAVTTTLPLVWSVVLSFSSAWWYSLTSLLAVEFSSYFYSDNNNNGHFCINLG